MAIDILKEIGASRRYTLHSHTEFCDGRAQMEAFAREAVRRGMTHYGFTPHSPLPIPSDCNMRRDDVSRYAAEFDRINRTYGARVRFFKGMEVDYLGPEFGPAHPYFASLGLDYTIGSVHFIPTREGEYVDIDGRFERFRRKMEEKFGGDIRYVVETFYESSLRMVEAGGFDIIGHFDKIGHNAAHYAPGIEQESWYKSLVDELIDAILARDLIVEINTKALAEHHRTFPDASRLPALVARGARLVVNSDVHVPALMEAGYEETYSLLDKTRAALRSENNDGLCR